VQNASINEVRCRTI